MVIEDKMNAGYWIRKLRLKPHPEGGYFRETFRAKGKIKALARDYSTAIYFLLEKGKKSRFHILKSDELWFFHTGGRVRLYLLGGTGKMKINYLGPENLQAVIPAGTWFAAEVTKGAFALVSCVVSPGFDFRDFRLGIREELTRKFPRYESIIRIFTILAES